jgi:SAM-dependent methyltransferase
LLVGYRNELYERSFEANRQAVLDSVAGLSVERMLDLGCGDGLLTRQVASRVNAGEIHGVEIEGTRAANARAQGVTVEEADLGQPLPYSSGSFDLIISHHVVEHLHNTDLHFSEIRRVASDSATIVMSTNNLSSWHNVVFLSLGWQPPSMHVSDQVIVGNPANDRDRTHFETPGDSHRRLFTVRGLEELAEFHGLVARRVRTVGYYPFVGRLAQVLSTIDWRHGAFIVAVFAPGERREFLGS